VTSCFEHGSIEGFFFFLPAESLLASEEDLGSTKLVRTDNLGDVMSLLAPSEYVGVLISLWLFLFSYLHHNQKNFSWMG
jgi:hypothetical protein